MTIQRISTTAPQSIGAVEEQPSSNIIRNVKNTSTRSSTIRYSIFALSVALIIAAIVVAAVGVGFSIATGLLIAGGLLAGLGCILQCISEYRQSDRPMVQPHSTPRGSTYSVRSSDQHFPIDPSNVQPRLSMKYDSEVQRLKNQINQDPTQFPANDFGLISMPSQIDPSIGHHFIRTKNQDLLYIGLSNQSITPEIIRQKMTDEAHAMGGSKVMLESYDGFVQLGFYDEDTDSTADTLKKIRNMHKNQNQLNADLLSDLSSVSPTYTVSDHLAIAVNSGTTLTKLIDQNEHIPINAFQQTLLDLDQMHQRDIFCNDISPSNFTYLPPQLREGLLAQKLPRNRVGNVLFIDTSDMYHHGYFELDPEREDLSERVPAVMKNCYTTSGLSAAVRLASIDDANYDSRILLPAQDNYAMLLVMMEASGVTGLPIHDSDYSEFDQYPLGIDIIEIDANTYLQDKFGHSVKLFTTKYYVPKSDSVKQWILRYIKAEYRNQVLSFLVDPLRNRLSKPLHAMMCSENTVEVDVQVQETDKVIVFENNMVEDTYL